jgi:hypothetical protein
MFEVLVALMMSFLFLTGTLNAMVVSAIFQVKAERQAQASYWIQEDLEQVRAVASRYTDTSGCSSGVGTAFNNADNDNDDNDTQGTYTDTNADNDTEPSNDGFLSVLSSSIREIVGADYTLNRVASVPVLPDGSLDTTSDISTLTYSVTRTVNGQTETLAELYTEVLPAAATSSCP